jgi:SAM-dependent methyltransferase
MSTGNADAEFRERLYGSYVSGFTGTPERSGAAPDLRHHVISRLPADREARVLDLGCGSGQLVALLHREGYGRVVGIDASSEQVAEARANGLTGVRQADAFDFLESGEVFDAIIAIDVLEHFDQPGVLRLLDAIAGALHPGGRLIFRSPNAGSPFFGRYRYGDLTHGTAFTASSVNQVLSATGFTDVEVFPTEPVPHGVVSFARLVLWKLITLVLSGYLAIESGEPRGHILTQNLVAVARKSGAARSTPAR